MTRYTIAYENGPTPCFTLRRNGKVVGYFNSLEHLAKRYLERSAGETLKNPGTPQELIACLVKATKDVEDLVRDVVVA